MMMKSTRWILIGSLVLVLMMGGLGLAMGERVEEAGALVEVTDNDIKEIIERLQDPKTRQEAIKEIERIGKPAGVHLSQIAKDRDKDQNSRVTSILLLGRTKAENARIDLEEILEEDKDKFCREAAAIALGESQDKEAIPKLKEAMKDESGNVRMRAVWALAKLQDKSGKRLALETLKGKDVTAQLLAVEALEAIGDKSIIDELKANVDDPDLSVWTKIHSKLAVKKLQVLGLNDIDRLNFLRETLKDEQSEVNYWAVKELGEEIIDNTPNRKQAIDILNEVAKDPRIPGSTSASKLLLKFIELGEVTREEIGE
ncbi:HEAT repeat domain-containing protein [bacterium]|nr:HEAT repeat domain-containing protein [bacterium]